MNYTVISFPGLGIEWNPGRAISVGPLTFNYYGMIIAFGMVLAMIYAWKRAKQFGVKTDDLTDGILCIVPFAVLCARLFYCAFEWDRYADNPISVLYIWEGGLAIYGGVLGAVAGIAVFAKIKKLNMGALLDLVVLGFLIGQCIGRWGNFFNREAFGSETDWFLRMGLLNSTTGQVEYHHPTFLYESAWNFVGFFVLHFLSKKRTYDGQVALGYAAWYGFGRTLIEGLRMDSLWWGPFRINQVLAALTCFGAVVVLLIMMVKKPDPKKMFVYKVEAAAAEKAVEQTADENASGE